ncbi:monocarboxylate transporter 12 [Elysia marginata]|uniref:Monocarboxylate transporter 12 n=1 Tax=Elysia marginata TaxID=1093978 RepID=A0AAV4IPP0_9GAST|nr:monocarboxylate transporter 12 [Elysia marginata]
MESSNEPVARLLTKEEHRRRWLVLAASFLILLINASLNYHVGVLNVAVTDNFSEAGEQTISWLMAIYASIFALGAPVGSAVVNLSSARTCVIISGLLSLFAMVLSSFVNRIEWLFLTLPLAGLGQSLSQVGGCVALAYYFPDKTALASGIASGRKAWEMHVEILRNTRYVILLVAVFIFGVAFQAIVVYLPEYLINSKGYSHLEAATVASCQGIGTLFSRTLVGFAATDAKIGLTLMFAGMSFVSSLVCSAAEAMMEYKAGAYFTALAHGIYASSTQILLLPLAIEILGQSKSETGYGLVMMMFGLGCLVGPPVAARILSTFGYSLLFRFSAALYLLSAVMVTQTHRSQHYPSTTNSIDSQAAAHSENPADAFFGSQYMEIVIPSATGSDETVKKETVTDEEAGEIINLEGETVLLKNKPGASSNCDGEIVEGIESFPLTTYLDNVLCS